ncbi:MAG TPA: hypothetical protein DCZ95_03755 [Verrucomicrobia bacterium]|nr:hypothetical protein [Verrucomicrobiota bacterium]
MAQGNGCEKPDCQYYGWTFDPTGRPWTCHHPDKKSERCPYAVTSPQTSQAPVIYPELEEDAEEMRNWYAQIVRR